MALLARKPDSLSGTLSGLPPQSGSPVHETADYAVRAKTQAAPPASPVEAPHELPRTTDLPPPSAPMPRRSALTPGRIVAERFCVMREIGRGGMGTVVLAEDIALHRKVALKFLRRDADPIDRDRFDRESRLLASLSHPNVVRVYTAGEHEERPFFAMEYLEGKTVDAILYAARDSWLPIDVVLGWAAQLCDALTAVHEAGYLHRDVKPGNVMVVDSTRAVLMDFGLAQSQSLRDAEHVSGTPHYLAPEDIRGRPLVGIEACRSDVYALGVTVFEMMTGQPPFQGASAQDVMLQHLRTVPPSASDLRPDVPAAIETVLRRAMAKNPEARQASCEELKDDLFLARYGDEDDAQEPIPDDVITARMDTM